MTKLVRCQMILCDKRGIPGRSNTGTEDTELAPLGLALPYLASNAL